MKIYGNLTNRVLEGGKMPDPTVGMGATLTAYSDRHAGTVVAVIAATERVVRVQEDAATRTDKNGMSEVQDYTFASDPNGRLWHFRKDRRGVWREVNWNAETGRWNLVDGGSGLLLGARNKYHDFGF